LSDSIAASRDGFDFARHKAYRMAIYRRDNHVAERFGQASNQEYPVGSYYTSVTTDHISYALWDIRAEIG
jgi:hypothetical protein